jgi:Ca2+-binding RTX toxin-like protein
MIRRRTVAGLLAAGALLAASAGLAADDAAAATRAEVQGTTLVVTGDNGPDVIALRLQAGVPTTLEVDVGDDGTAEASFDRATFDLIDVNARRGDDTVRIDDANGAFTDTEITTIVGAGDDDTLEGGAGRELFVAGSGADVVDGNGDRDLAVMGSGADTFVWDPGDGSDVVEGQAGADTLDFRGSDSDEIFDLSPNGPRALFTRNVGNITMDVNDLERVDLKARGGADAMTVHDLGGTGVRRVTADLAALLGGLTADNRPDALTVEGTAGADEVSIRREGDAVAVRGLAARVVITHSEADDPDALTLDTRGGADTVRLGGGLGGLIRTTVTA